MSWLQGHMNAQIPPQNDDMHRLNSNSIMRVTDMCMRALLIAVVVMYVVCLQVQHTRMLGACIDLGMPSVNIMGMCREATAELRREELFGHLQNHSL
jgi:hypothetical protein